MYSGPVQKIPLKRAIGYVLLSVFVIWGSLILTWLLHRSLLEERQQNSSYNIVALVQTCPQKEALQNWQLAELLQLSRDEPQNLFTFDTKVATAALLACPVVKKATCRRQPPGIVHIDYKVREPCALLANTSNVALDSERFCFPLRPYFTPKILPELYVGEVDVSYGASLDSKEATLAFSVLDYVKKGLPVSCRIIRIDTHNAYAKSAGIQEVVVVLEQSDKTRYIRFDPRTFKESFDCYKDLSITFDQINSASREQIIDMRSPSIALVK